MAVCVTNQPNMAEGIQGKDVYISKGYLRPSGSLQCVGFTAVMCWTVGMFSGRNRAV